MKRSELDGAEREGEVSYKPTTALVDTKWGGYMSSNNPS